VIDFIVKAVIKAMADVIIKWATSQELIKVIKRKKARGKRIIANFKKA